MPGDRDLDAAPSLYTVVFPPTWVLYGPVTSSPRWFGSPSRYFHPAVCGARVTVPSPGVHSPRRHGPLHRRTRDRYRAPLWLLVCRSPYGYSPFGFPHTLPGYRHLEAAHWTTGMPSGTGKNPRSLRMLTFRKATEAAVEMLRSSRGVNNLPAANCA